MAKKRFGIDELFKSTVIPAVSLEGGIAQVELDKVFSNTGQPRRYFDEASLQRLVESIKKNGVLQPILVREKEQGYEIVAGERRFLAARLAGLRRIPAIIRNLSDEEAARLALVENLQREDLNPIEETEGYLALLRYRLQQEPDFFLFSCPNDEDPYGDVVRLLFAMNNLRNPKRRKDDSLAIKFIPVIEEVFNSVGKISWVSFVQHKLPLRKLPADVLDALRSGRLEYTKAKQISRLTARVFGNDAKAALQARSEMLELAMEKKVSASELQRLVEEKLYGKRNLHLVKDRLVKLLKITKSLKSLSLEQEAELLRRLEELETYVSSIEAAM
ncbi:MAG: ParB/RepB/Spo0J family partition protein [Acidobacteriota bacterium]|nr:ParB/RepB/Spo0J family partition protein [Blastocatellia bacterium]MDW8413251.1 ParB/RepB/Spo0J family partition protein [Acidobacteriota bacterium]